MFQLKKVVYPKYSEQDLIMLAKKYEWQGDGTKEDPLVVESNKEIKKGFHLLNSELYIFVKKGKFGKVYFKQCRNIFLEKCKFRRVSLVDCTGVTFLGCKMSNCIMRESTFNEFRTCSIERLLSLSSQGNTFEKCKISKDIKK